MIKSFDIIKQKGFTMAIMVIVTLLCIYLSVRVQSGMGLVLGFFPFALIFTYLCILNQYIALILLALVNYFIMGLGRYISIPIPVSALFDVIFGFIFVTVLFRNLANKENFRNVFNLYFAFMLVWFAYCFINVGNHATGTIHFTAWLGNVRVISLYALVTSVIIAISAKNYKFIHWFLILWGILTLLAAAKGYWQKNHGFDAAEWAWVSTRGANTHLLRSGIRFFSFFSDAASYGCGMGLSLVTFFLSFFYVKNKYRKVFYLLIAAAGGYGLLISGTRAAIAVPVAGLG